MKNEYLTSWSYPQPWADEKPMIMSSYYVEGDIVCRLNKGYILRTIFEPEKWLNRYDYWCEINWGDEYNENWDYINPETDIIQPNEKWSAVINYLMNEITIDELWIMTRLDENSPESFFHWEYRFKLEDGPMEFFDIMLVDLLMEIDESPEYKAFNRNKRLDDLFGDTESKK